MSELERGDLDEAIELPGGSVRPMVGDGIDTRLVVVFVEIPAGSRNKYEVDKKTGAIFLDRRLFTSTTYPADYGFIEDTLGGDGDPLDALVLAGDPTFPGCRIRARPIGLFRMTDEKGPDEKIICVSARDPFWARFNDLGELDENLLNEIDHFFRVYKELETDKVDTRGFGERSEAERVIAESLARYVDSGSTR